jgi:alpha-L-fucosidase
MKRIHLLIILTICFFSSISTQTAVAGKKNDTTNSKLAWFQDAKFGMFIHWGVYSKLAGEWNGKSGYSEFVMLNAKIPISQYEQVAKTLNPIDFNAEKWVLAAKRAGMKYIVITSKHHEGFAMFNSPSDPYNIVNFTAFKRDPVKELADACRKYGVKFGVYYSLGRDWHDPNVPTNWPVKGGRSNTWDFPNEDAKDFSKYFERKVKPQVTELITQYHPAILWFDTPELINKEQSRELREMILKLSPTCIINERIGNEYGDYLVLEQKGGDKIIPGIWETCITMSRNWGYVKKDTIFKSSEKLIGLLVDAVSKGGNLLLNAGPTPEGIIRPENLSRMADIGKWLSVNGEAIYGSKPWKVFGENADESAYKAQQGFKAEEKDAVFDGTPKDVVQDIRFTTRGNSLYVIARSWRQKEVQVKSLTKNGNQIKTVELLGYKGRINWKQTEAATSIEIPAKAVSNIPVYVFKIILNH